MIKKKNLSRIDYFENNSSHEWVGGSSEKLYKWRPQIMFAAGVPHLWHWLLGKCSILEQSKEQQRTEYPRQVQDSP